MAALVRSGGSPGHCLSSVGFTFHPGGTARLTVLLSAWFYRFSLTVWNCSCPRPQMSPAHGTPGVHAAEVMRVLRVGHINVRNLPHSYLLFILFFEAGSL